MNFFGFLGKFAGNGGFSNGKGFQLSVFHLELVSSLGIDILGTSDIVYEDFVWVDGVFLFVFVG